MNIRAYVASKYQNQAEVQEVHGKLREAGIQITHDWTRHEEPIGATREALAVFAIEDVKGVVAADALIVVFPSDGTPLSVGCGVEIGIALMRGIPIFLIGDPKPKSVFFDLPQCVLYATIEEWIEDFSKGRNLWRPLKNN